MKYCCKELKQSVDDFSVWDENFIAPPVPDDGYKHWWMWASKPDKSYEIHYCPFCGNKLILEE